MRIWIVTVTLIASLLVWAHPASADTADVVVIGDSILNLTSDDVAPMLANQGWHAHIVAQNGSGLTPTPILTTGRDWVETLAQMDQQYHPDTVVIVLGTNDAPTIASSGIPYGPFIDQLLAATKARRILWANCSRNTGSEVYNAGCTAIDAALDEEDAQRDNMEVIPYDPTITHDPYFGGTDSVHPGPVGQLKFARLIAYTVGSPK